MVALNPALERREAGRSLVEAELLDYYIDCLKRTKVKKSRQCALLDPIRKGRAELADAMAPLMQASQSTSLAMYKCCHGDLELLTSLPLPPESAGLGDGSTCMQHSPVYTRLPAAPGALRTLKHPWPMLR